jgi:chemotaxis protein CheC
VLTPDQRDALQELANVGMGRAGAMIAKILDQFVRLSIPKLSIVKREQVADSIAQLTSQGNVSAVRQAFHSRMRGEAICIFSGERFSDLAGMMGYDQEPDQATETEILLDITGVLVGACLGSIARQLDSEIGFSPPSLVAKAVPVTSLLRLEGIAWESALLLEVSFELEQRSFACHILIVIPDTEMQALSEALTRILESL